MAETKSIVCTLFERDYHLGVAALVNSLCRHGYEGTVYVGYRGDLPPWIGPRAGGDSDSEFQATDRVTVRFIRLITDVHLCNYKPTFMLSLLDKECPDAGACYYFDPDIVILCRWSYFVDWVLGGVALCVEDATTPATHPIRHAWRRYFEPLGVTLDREQPYYFNSGFLGVTRAHRTFLETWEKLIRLSGPAAGGLKYLKSEDPTSPFFIPDQDTFNATTMACQEPLACIGPDGMSLFSEGFIMSHAIGKPKPWEKRALWDVIRRGARPTRADKAFLKYSTSPVPVYTPLRFWFKRFAMASADRLGRLRPRLS
jgi:hypothetical protein